MQRLIFLVFITFFISTVSYAQTYKLPELSYTDSTRHSWAEVTGKIPVLNRGQITEVTDCNITERPVYNNSGGELIGTVFGMIFGGILGHKAGGESGAITGSILGGIAGKEVTKDPNMDRAVIGTSKRKHCQTKKLKNVGDFQVIGFIYKLRDWVTNEALPSIGSQSDPSQKNYVVGQKIPYRAGFVYGNN